MAIEVHYAEGGPPARHETTLPLHSCRFEHRPDELAAPGVEQYLIRCRCHSSSWQIWRPGDPPFVCPSTLGGLDKLDDVRPGLPRTGAG
jgi:hypothetical protein